MSDEGFFSRWSRRKAGEVEPVEAEPRLVPPAPDKEALPAASAQPASFVSRDAGESALPASPTLEDVGRLTADSDFSRFVAVDVDESVKQAAMKKLFSDPHFNLMDGLDTYIDDYGKPDPIPESMLRRMVQSAALGLFDHEDKEEGEPKASPDGASSAPMSQSSPATEEVVPPDEDPDLRLQQDDAARPVGPCPGPGA